MRHETILVFFLGALVVVAGLSSFKLWKEYRCEIKYDVPHCEMTVKFLPDKGSMMIKQQEAYRRLMEMQQQQAPRSQPEMRVR